MAYVAVTDKTINTIKNEIVRMRNAELATLDNVPAEFEKIMSIPELREEVELAAWGEFADLRSRLRTRLCWAGNIELTVYHAKQIADQSTNMIRSTVTVKVDNFPFGIINVDGHSYYRTNSFKYKFPFDHPHAQIQHLSQLLAERYEVNKRWDKVENQIVTFIRNAKSINEAVKLWPDVRAYLPPTVIGKLEEKSERKTAATSSAQEMMSKMDIETLKHSAVIGKMLGGK